MNPIKEIRFKPLYEVDDIVIAIYHNKPIWARVIKRSFIDEGVEENEDTPNYRKLEKEPVIDATLLRLHEIHYQLYPVGGRGRFTRIENDLFKDYSELLSRFPLYLGNKPF